ncbi:unnamed protein product, partial [Hermetia illucens]
CSFQNLFSKQKLLVSANGRYRPRAVEYSYNHVDRVRINQLSSTPPGLPVPGSRRRQNVANHLDLATTAPEHLYPHLKNNKRFSDCNNNQKHLNLEDYYTHIQGEKTQQYEENYYESYENNNEGDDSYRYLREGSGNDVCSLRRTRSLAVIREETYNDLQINSARNSRRSQLIPRAKLVNRSFNKERYHQNKHNKTEEGSSGGSGGETQTSETRDTDDYYTNLKRLDSVKVFRSSWQNEKSDLDSINSDYFKNSQHQSSEFADVNQKPGKAPGDRQFEVLELEVHQESSVLPETTTSNSDRSDSSTIEGGGEFQTHFQSENFTYTERTLTPNQSQIDQNNLVISYDSIYLSSEDSSGETLLRNAIPAAVGSSPESDSFTQVTIEHCDSADRLYTRVNKTSTASTKPKILAVTTKRGALERLTSISTSQILKTNDIHVIDSYRPSHIDNHYCSLPDINIGRSLKVSERIDDKLRSSYEHSRKEYSSECSNSLSTRKTKRVRQRQFSEIDSLASANISLITVHDPLVSDDANHEQNSLVERENQQSEIEIIHETFVREDDGLDELSPEEITSQEDISQENISESSSPEVDFLLNHTTQNFPGQIRIIVTDSKNNIIEEDSIESSASKALEQPDNNNNLCEWNFNETNNDPDNNDDSDELKDSINPHQFYVEQAAHIEPTKEKFENGGTNSVAPTCWPMKSILKKECHKERKAEIYFPPPPPIICDSLSPTVRTSFGNKFKADRPFRSNEENSVVRNFTTVKMSRPQILHVIDSKRHVDCKNGRDSSHNVAKEFLEKVDSVKCYWSKIAQNDSEIQAEETSNVNSSKGNNDQISADEVDSSKCESIIAATNAPGGLKSEFKNVLNSDFQSFSPTVEIIELDGEKQATIVKAGRLDEADFDHVRYKVMKPDQFQKDLLNRSKKEAQFDGLIQYLQDYSFQELLSKNNIVIIEPVRTKIEKPVETAAKLEPLNCKITGGSGTDTKSPAKRHFFYQPVRVNRELLEEELPNPDTVRNVRRFFEEHSLQKQSADTSYGNTAFRRWDSASLSSGISSGDLSSPCECNEDHRHYHNDQQHHHQHQHHSQHNGRSKARRDLGCEREDIEDDDQEVFTSEENLCEDEMCEDESYYVSEDVLEKIRECGSTVTYYGGRVVNNKSPELSPMTRAIMQEIRGKESSGESMTTSTASGTRTCRTCQPNNCPQEDDIEREFRDNKHLGIQFKLVKSNSCSSRLELVGTDKFGQSRSTSTAAGGSNRSPSPTRNPEETVRELVNRLESGTIKNSSAPRIIESKCIEKTYRRSLPPIKTIPTTNEGITINNHHIGTKEYLGLVDIINHVTVNNHIPYNAIPSDEKPSDKIVASSNKIPRNKNVDLAFAMSRGGQVSKTISTSPLPEVKTLNHTDKVESRHPNSSCSVLLEPSQSPVATTEINKVDLEQSNKSPPQNGPSASCDDSIRNTFALEEDMDAPSSKANGGEQMTTPIKLPHDGQPALSPTTGTTPIKLLTKHYVANDKRLIEQRKYNEIEFEEFEVYNPATAHQDNINGGNNNSDADPPRKDQINGKHSSSSDIVESFEERI